MTSEKLLRQIAGKGLATDIRAITPSDSAMDDVPLKIRCLTNGTVVVKTLGRLADATTYSRAMTAGQELDIPITHLMSTGTSGTYEGYF